MPMFQNGWDVGKVLTEQELEAIAKERLNEDPQRRSADIRAIKDWLNKQPHLKENARKGTCRTNHQGCVTFLNLFQMTILSSCFCEVANSASRGQKKNWTCGTRSGHTVRTFSRDGITKTPRLANWSSLGMSLHLDSCPTEQNENLTR